MAWTCVLVMIGILLTGPSERCSVAGADPVWMVVSTPDDR